MSGFCHFGLVIHGFVTEPWHSLLVLFFWWVRCFECARAARFLVYVLGFMLERGFRIPALLSCFRLSSGFVSEFGHSRSRFGLAVGACGLKFARAVRSSVRVHSLSSFCFLLFCLVLCGTQLVFFTGCVLSCLSCFVCTRGLWVSLLAACLCPVLHMASDSVTACVLVLCEHMAFVVCHVLLCQLSWLHPSCFQIIG